MTMPIEAAEALFASIPVTVNHSGYLVTPPSDDRV